MEGRETEATLPRPSHAGPCEKEIEELCEDLEQGEGKLAECISDAITESEGGADGEEAASMLRPFLPSPFSAYPYSLPSHLAHSSQRETWPAPGS